MAVLQRAIVVTLLLAIMLAGASARSVVSREEVGDLITRAFEDAKEDNSAWKRLSDLEKETVAAKLATSIDLEDAGADSARGERGKGEHRFASLSLSAESGSGASSPFTALYDASTGLAEPSAACKTNVNGFLSKCVFPGGAGGNKQSTNGGAGAGGLSKSCTSDLNTWLTKCVFAAKSDKKK